MAHSNSSYKPTEDIKESNDDVQKRSSEQLDELLLFCDTHVGQNWVTVDLLVEAMAGTKEVRMGAGDKSC